MFALRSKATLRLASALRDRLALLLLLLNGPLELREVVGHVALIIVQELGRDGDGLRARVMKYLLEGVRKARPERDARGREPSGQEQTRAAGGARRRTEKSMQVSARQKLVGHGEERTARWKLMSLTASLHFSTF